MEAYCRAADSAFGKTSQLVGTIRIHWPVTNSRIKKITPLSTHSVSNEKWMRWFIEIFLGSPLVLMNLVLSRVQNESGLGVERMSHPERTISNMKNMLRKCCQFSHAGNPTGAPSGSSYSPGYFSMKAATASRLRSQLAMSTTMTIATIATPAQIAGLIRDLGSKDAPFFPFFPFFFFFFFFEVAIIIFKRPYVQGGACASTDRFRPKAVLKHLNARSF